MYLNKMKRISLLTPFILILLIVSTACDSKSSLVSKINKSEAVIFSDSTADPDNTKVKDLTDLYLKYADNYPEDTLSAEYLFKAADLFIYLRDFRSTLTMFDRIQTKYPLFSKLDKTYFLKAFIYEQHLNEPEKAAELYRQFITKFPKSELADDASQALLFVGKSDAEIMQMLNERAADSTLQTQTPAQ